MAAVEEEVRKQMLQEESVQKEGLVLDSQRRSEELDTPSEEFGHGMSLGIANTIGLPVDVVNAMLNAAGIQSDAPFGGGDSIMDVMEALGAAPADAPDQPVSAEGRAGEALGMATVMTPLMMAPFLEMAMDPNFELRQGAEMSAFSGGAKPGEPGRIPRTRAARAAFLLKQLGQNITKTAVENPKTFVAAEAAGALASGYAMGKIEEDDGTPGQQMAAGLGAGVAASLTVAGIPRALTSAWRWGMRNMIPFTEVGGEARAASQIQARTENIPRAAAAIEDAPPGVTPARATGERRLMGQEARVLEDDPAMDLLVREDLKSAIRRSQSELRGLYDTPRGRADWERTVIQRLAPEGTDIPAGSTDEMIDALYQSFGDLYGNAKGFPIRNRLYLNPGATLDTQMANVSKSRAVMAGGGTRKQVRSWLENQMEGLRKKTMTIDGERAFYDSGDLLTVRSRIRTEIRKQRRSTTSGSNERADLLEIAEQRITGLLHDQMPEEALAGLKQTDDFYRNYKLLEDSVYRSGEGVLTPENLLMSLRNSASSHGAYARGESMELRSLANSGRQIDRFMGNPDQVARMTANMAEDDILNLKSQFMEELFRKSIPQNQFGPDGEELISGLRLQGNRNKFMPTARALGMTDDEIGRLDEIIKQIRLIEANPETAVAQLFEDGPSTIMELGATLLGAKSGQRLAEGGIGSSMVMASYGANKWRGFLGRFTSDKAESILRRAVTDPELFRSLMLKPNALPAEKNKAFQLLMNALALPTYETGEQLPEAVEDSTKIMKEQLEEVRRQAESLGPLF